MSDTAARTQLMVDLDAGADAMVRAIEREPRRACVPGWPWRAMDVVVRVLPLRAMARF